MAQSRTKAIAKSSAVNNNIEVALERLTTAFNDSANAVSVKGTENTKLATQIKRLSKKRTTLMKRKKTATTKAKKAPGVDTRKALSMVVKELTSTSNQLAKLRTQKTTVAEELTALKAGQKKATAYLTAIEKVDKVLNKPKKKVRRRKKKIS